MDTRLTSKSLNAQNYKNRDNASGSNFREGFFSTSSSEIKPNGQAVSAIRAKLNLLTGNNSKIRGDITTAISNYRATSIQDILTQYGFEVLELAQQVTFQENGECPKGMLQKGMKLLQYDLLKFRHNKINDESLTNGIDKRTKANLSANISIKKTKKIASSDFAISIGAVIKAVNSPKEMDYMSQLVKLAFQDQAISEKKYEYLRDLIISETEEKILELIDCRDRDTFNIDKLILIFDYRKLLKSYDHQYGRLNGILHSTFYPSYKKMVQVLARAKTTLEDTITNYHLKMKQIKEDAKSNNTVVTLTELEKAMSAIAKILLANRIIGTSAVGGYVGMYSGLYNMFYDNFKERSETYLNPDFDALEVHTLATESYNLLVENQQDISELNLEKLENLLPEEEGKEAKEAKKGEEGKSSIATSEVGSFMSLETEKYPLRFPDHLRQIRPSQYGQQPPFSIHNVFNHINEMKESSKNIFKEQQQLRESMIKEKAQQHNRNIQQQIQLEKQQLQQQINGMRLQLDQQQYPSPSSPEDFSYPSSPEDVSCPSYPENVRDQVARDIPQLKLDIQKLLAQILRVKRILPGDISHKFQKILQNSTDTLTFLDNSIADGLFVNNSELKSSFQRTLANVNDVSHYLRRMIKEGSF